MISSITPAQAGLPTPCTRFDLRALVNHILYDQQVFTAMISGGQRGSPDVDLLGSDWLAAYRSSADSLLSALAWGHESLKPEIRGQAFGPELSVPENAPIYDRLAGFFGRPPTYQRG